MIERNEEKLSGPPPNPDRKLFEQNAFGEIGSLQRRFADLSLKIGHEAGTTKVIKLFELQRKLYRANKTPAISSDLLREIDQGLIDLESETES